MAKTVAEQLAYLEADKGPGRAWLVCPVAALAGLVKVLGAIEAALEDGKPLPAEVDGIPLADAVSYQLSGLSTQLLDAGYDPDDVKPLIA